MKKPTAASKRAFEKKIGELAVEISNLHQLVQTSGIGAEGVIAACGHLQQVLNAARQSALVSAQTNDAGNFSLSNPVAAHALAAMSGFTPEGRLVGQPRPQNQLPAVSSEGDGEEGILLA